MDARRPGARRARGAHAARRASRSRTPRAGVRARRLPAHARRRPRRSTRCWPQAGRGDRAAARARRVRGRDRAAHLRRASARTASAARTTSPTWCATASRVYLRGDAAGARPLPRPPHAGERRRRHGLARRGVRPPAGARWSSRDRPQVLAGAGQDGGRRRGRRRDAGRHARRGQARRDDARARPAGRAHDPPARRHPDVQGLPRLPGLHLRVAERHDRARHPGRRTRSATATSSPSTSA